MDFTKLINPQGHAVIPENIDKIPQKTFMYNRSLVSIEIPSSVKEIQANAFAYSNLTSITIPSSVTKIGNNCFNFCLSLKSITLPDGIKTIGTGLLSGCSQLEEIVIPQKVTTIEENAFSNCRALKKVILPDSLKTIGNNVFAGCESLIEIVLPDGVEEIGSNTFKGCVNLKKVVLPKSLMSLSRGLFTNCTALENVTIPDNIKFIPDNIFEKCSSLVSLNIPEGVSSLGYSCFNGCTSLKTINIPVSIQTIGAAAFNGCSSLEVINVPEGISKIEGYDSFAGCTALHLHLPSTLEDLPSSIDAKQISIAPGNKFLELVDGCVIVKATKTLRYFSHEMKGIPDKVSRIDAVNEITTSFFASVEELTIPEGVEYISSLPFSCMANLKKVTFPKSLKKCGYDFMKEYPFDIAYVSLDLLLCPSFTSWREISKVELVGVDSISAENLEKIKEKYKKDKSLCVYLNGENIYPAAHIVKKKEESLLAAEQKEENEKLSANKKELMDKIEDTANSALCSATFEPLGIPFIYDSAKNSINITVFDELKLEFPLSSNAKDDILFMADVAGCLRKTILSMKKDMSDVTITRNKDIHIAPKGKYNIGYYLSNRALLVLGMQSDCSKEGLNMLKALNNTYSNLVTKYGEKMNQISLTSK